MSFTLSKEFSFEAAHKLPRHDGKCARLHGHSWKLVVIIVGGQLEQKGPKSGMLLDYADISKVVKPLIEESLDHHYLNETTELENPTSEELAVWIYNKLDGKLKGLWGVKIEETCTSGCLYTR